MFIYIYKVRSKPYTSSTIITQGILVDHASTVPPFGRYADMSQYNMR